MLPLLCWHGFLVGSVCPFNCTSYSEICYSLHTTHCNCILCNYYAEKGLIRSKYTFLVVRSTIKADLQPYLLDLIAQSTTN
ncbi:hypothetical protein PAECIP111892_03564 [Paenibacillus auburnensis]|uniref:Secreted protein n=1 Tax=Paenibacillus auburnensis TaxID=2905649 RepID=A0ABM9CFF1_9BACL|nr:hypothetical protein PAECIP111892_03564 [Paenibacillus auburnensis]